MAVHGGIFQSVPWIYGGGFNKVKSAKFLKSLPMYSNICAYFLSWEDGKIVSWICYYRCNSYIDKFISSYR